MTDAHNFVDEPARRTPIFDSVDVLVAGGGPTGIAAALAAAREGARTMLVERYGYLGGMATAGLIAVFTCAALSFFLRALLAPQPGGATSPPASGEEGVSSGAEEADPPGARPGP